MYTKTKIAEGFPIGIMQLDDCLLIPSYLGKPAYFAGFPIPPDSVSFNDISAQNLFIKKVGEGLSQEEEQFLKEYCIYFLYAPVWSNPVVDAAKLKMKKSLDLSGMLEILLDVGIDPF